MACCVVGCFNTIASKPDLVLFSIPSDSRRDEWLRLIAREDLKDKSQKSYYRVCQEHFSRDVILFNNKRNTLKRTALPSRYLPSLEAKTKTKAEADLLKSCVITFDLASKLTQTDNDLVAETEASQDSQDVVASDPSVYGIDEQSRFYDLCDEYLTEDLASLIKTNNNLRYKNFKSNNDDFLKFCKNLYQTSPQAYLLFQTIYGLPMCDILFKQYVQIGTKVNDTVMLTIKARVNKMTAKEKNCSVLIKFVKLKANLCYNIKEDKIYGFQEIDEVQSPKPTTTAVVVMIRGLFFSWKQPIGYILVSGNHDQGTIQNWTYSLIKQLFEIGLNVRTLVTSTNDNWIDPSVSIETPFFHVNDKKIYLINDAPNLVKSARDCIISNNIHFQDKVAKYEDIINFYKTDQNKKLPYARKLTESHINPNKREKEHAKYAIELMSKTVANGIWNYMQFELIKADIGTVEYISNTNDLFDILNVSKQNHSASERKTYKDIKDTSYFFENMKVIHRITVEDITLSQKFLKDILITIKAVALLADDLKSEGYIALSTKNLQRKTLDDFINKLASHVKKTPAKLTTLQFTVAFRKLFLSNLKEFTQRGSTKGEMTHFLAKTISRFDEEMTQIDTTKKDLQNQSGSYSIQISNPRSAKNSNNEEKIKKEDYDAIDSSNRHDLLYICGYLLIQVKKYHKNCHILKHYLYDYQFEHKLEDGRFQRYNQYIQEKKSNDLPAVACDHFIRFVEEMDEKFVKAFTNKHLCERIADSLYKDIEAISLSDLPCPCFPKTYAMKLFIRIKLFYTIRMNNNSFKANRRTRKSLESIFLVPKL